MSMNYRELANKSNVTFIGIALVFFVFIQSIFPVLSIGVRNSGSTPPLMFLSVVGICSTIRDYFVICAIITALYYVVSLRFKPEVNIIINSSILFVLAIFMFFLSGSLVEVPTDMPPLK